MIARGAEDRVQGVGGAVRAAGPDEAAAQIKSYLDAGLNHLVFHGPGHDQLRFLDQMAADVIPRVRALL